MKRILLSCITIFCILLSAGCLNSNAGMNSSTTPSSTDEVSGLAVSSPLSDNEQIIYTAQQGRLTRESVADTVTVFVGSMEESDIFTDVYLEVETNGKVLTFELGRWEYGALRDGGGLFLADLNGDGIDEIILFMEVTGNGGTIAQVFTVQTDEIILRYDLNEIDIGLDTLYQDGYTVLLENESVGFSEVIDIAKEFGSEHFDKNGQFTGTSEVFLGSVHSGNLEPATHDELPKISCKRDVYLTNYLGELHLVFRYNPETESLVLISIDLKT